ncbi:MAG: T9SS type A sorting domain-containing protein [bacterium]
MRWIICSTIVLMGFIAGALAEVKPVVYDHPLAIRQQQSVPRQLLSLTPRRYDEWLNVRINSDMTGQVQNEQQIVVNPQNPNNLVAVWRDFRLGYRRVGMGRSFDGGRTWFDSLFYEPTYAWQSDPGLTWHSSGAIYAIVLSYYPNFQGEDGLFVSKSLDGGMSWGTFVPAVNAIPNSFEDKELIACDRTGGLYDGNLYIAWARFTNNMSVSRITMVRSTTEGSTWEQPVSVSDGTGVQWPLPAVGANGEVYVAWVKYSPPGIYMDQSLDGGVSWGGDRLIQSTDFASAYINPYLMIFSYPAMDVDITNGPFHGFMYIAYADQMAGSSDTDILFTASQDGGNSWTHPIRLNDDSFNNGCDQFHPWLVCDEEGILHLIFYDRRNDPGQNLYMDLYYTYSTNAGLSWAPNRRITNVSSNPANDSLDSGLIGEYNGLAVRNGIIHPIWTDTRFGHQDTFTAVWQDTVSSIWEGETASNNGFPLGSFLHVSPNPCNGEVRVSLTTPIGGDVQVAIFDILGRRVVTLFDGDLIAGNPQWSWKPDAGAGVYFVRARWGKRTEWKKIVYVP